MSVLRPPRPMSECGPSVRVAQRPLRWFRAPARCRPEAGVPSRTRVFSRSAGGALPRDATLTTPGSRQGRGTLFPRTVGAGFVVVCSSRSRDPWLRVYLYVLLMPAGTACAGRRAARRADAGPVLPAGIPDRRATASRTGSPATMPSGRRGVAQSGRAPGSGSGGRRFKSCRPDAARPSGRVPGPEAAMAFGSSGRIFHSAPPARDRALPFGTHQWARTCIFRRSCPGRRVPASALFHALAS